MPYYLRGKGRGIKYSTDMYIYLHSHPIREMLTACIHKWGKQEPESLGDQPKTTQTTHERARISKQVTLAPESRLFPITPEHHKNCWKIKDLIKLGKPSNTNLTYLNSFFSQKTPIWSSANIVFSLKTMNQFLL